VPQARAAEIWNRFARRMQEDDEMSTERSRHHRVAGRSLALAAVTLMVALAVVAAACGDGGAPAGDSGGAKTGDTIVGAGASFPFPLYSQWGQEYNAETGKKLNYQSIGSGGGISAIEQNTVDFGASDAPLDASELESEGLVQFPMCVGGVVPVVSLDGVESGALKLNAATLAGIYAGTITKWNDADIAALNSGVDLPDSEITVVHRSDSSGTTWIFTSYLTAAAGDVWTAGADKEIDWPTGVGGKGNEGVAASVQQVKGSIGYVEYAYAKQNDMTWTQLQNKDGKVVDPSLESLARSGDVADHRRLVHHDAEGAGRCRPRRDDPRLLRLGLHQRRRQRRGARLRPDPLVGRRHRARRDLAADHGRRRTGLEVAQG
jgi:phosphate transport system substrate-binding protein